MCVHMFIAMSAHTCMCIYICTVFLKKILFELYADWYKLIELV
jgi:hypothetical protein